MHHELEMRYHPQSQKVAYEQLLGGKWKWCFMITGGLPLRSGGHKHIFRTAQWASNELPEHPKHTKVGYMHLKMHLEPCSRTSMSAGEARRVHVSFSHSSKTIPRVLIPYFTTGMLQPSHFPREVQEHGGKCIFQVHICGFVCCLGALQAHELECRWWCNPHTLWQVPPSPWMPISSCLPVSAYMPLFDFLGPLEAQDHGLRPTCGHNMISPRYYHKSHYG